MAVQLEMMSVALKGPQMVEWKEDSTAESMGNNLAAQTEKPRAGNLVAKWDKRTVVTRESLRAAMMEEYLADLKEYQMVVLMEPWTVATTESLTVGSLGNRSVGLLAGWKVVWSVECSGSQTVAQTEMTMVEKKAC